MLTETESPIEEESTIPIEQLNAEEEVRRLVEIARTGIVRYQTVEITPHIARAMQNILLSKNRNINEQDVETYARLMTEGKFLEGTALIQIDEDGYLNNGQHRLRSSIRSGISFKCCIATGVSRDSYLAIDTGKPKKAKDFLKAAADTPELASLSTDLAATLRWIFGWSKGSLLRTPKNLAPSVTDLLGDILPNHPSVQVSVKFADRKDSPLLSGSVMAFIHYAFHRIDDRAAEEFISALNGEGSLSPDMPVHMLRERLLMATSGRKQNKLTTIEKLVYCITAWDLYKNGIRPKALRLEYDEPRGRAKHGPLKIPNFPYPGPEQQEETSNGAIPVTA